MQILFMKDNLSETLSNDSKEYISSSFTSVLARSIIRRVC